MGGERDKRHGSSELSVNESTNNSMVYTAGPPEELLALLVLLALPLPTPDSGGLQAAIIFSSASTTNWLRAMNGTWKMLRTSEES